VLRTIGVKPNSGETVVLTFDFLGLIGVSFHTSMTLSDKYSKLVVLEEMLCFNFSFKMSIELYSNKPL
jgi:hypothetical protein